MMYVKPAIDMTKEQEDLFIQSFTDDKKLWNEFRACEADPSRQPGVAILMRNHLEKLFDNAGNLYTLPLILKLRDMLGR